MKKIILLVVLFSAISSRSQNCDSLVPVFTVDFTGISTDSIWNSPSVLRNGYCCTASGFDKCIHFVVITDGNACGLSVDYYGQLPIGAQFNQLCCGPPIVLGDTFFVQAGTHHITFCKPGNNYITYNIHAFTNCSSPVFDTSCAVITGVNSNNTAQNKTALFPNPFHSSATLMIDADEAVFKIFDLPGRLLREENIQRKSVINRQSLPDGVYYYQVIKNFEVVGRGKFIIE